MENEKLIDELNNISNVIYKGEVTQGIAAMAAIIPSLAETVEKFSDDQQANFLNIALKPALEAMEDRDGTALADIISYEIIPILEQI